MNKTSAKKKTVSKRNKKNQINSFSDAVKAFMLVGVIVVITFLISCAVILARSSFSSLIDERQPLAGQNTEPEFPLNSADLITQEPADQVTNPARSDGGNNSSREPVNNSPEQQNVSLPLNDPARINTTAQPADTNTRNQNDTQPARNQPTANTTSSPDQTRVQNQNNTNVVSHGALVFVIDDAGNNLRELDPFLRVPFPLTIAVLPGLPYSTEAARRIRAAGKEVILHQPMEAIGAQNPGPGAIYSGMSAEEIRLILSRNIAEVGPVTGINNHQGSKITMDLAMMKVILEFCAEHGIYYLDSRTTADSVVPAAARQIGMKIAERNIFIDNEQNKSAMLRYIENGLARARQNGNAVMIGHTWSPDLAPLLMEQLPRYAEQGYTVKTVSDILKQ